MLVACWSAKGGVGTTVVAAALGAMLAGDGAAGALLVDLGGDLPAALGVEPPEGPGLQGWLGAGAMVPPDALARLEVPAGRRLALIPRGSGDVPDGIDRGPVLASLLAADARPVVVDCGVVGVACSAVAAAIAASATRSLLVTRACYLALRRAQAAPLRPSAVVLVTEPGRSLLPADVSHALGAPVCAEVPFDPAIARSVDAGVLGDRVPRPLARALRGVV